MFETCKNCSEKKCTVHTPSISAAISTAPAETCTTNHLSEGTDTDISPIHLNTKQTTDHFNISHVAILIQIDRRPLSIRLKQTYNY